MVRAKNYETMSTFDEVMQKKLWPLFFRTRCRYTRAMCIVPNEFVRYLSNSAIVDHHVRPLRPFSNWNLSTADNVNMVKLFGFGTDEHCIVMALYRGILLCSFTVYSKVLFKGRTVLSSHCVSTL